jgi:alginate O-acetyltransferase complex protein AlgI
VLFNSFHFFVFLAISFLLYYGLGQKFRQPVLLVASICFIAILSPNLVLFTFAFITLNYFLGKALENYLDTKWRLKIFWFAIITNVGILSFYKYINFFFENINAFLNFFYINSSIPYLSLVIPVGISYYTFQALGYIIRINRRAEKAERNFVVFANYLAFFPKFLAGPVERSNHFFPQVNAGIRFKEENVTAGLRLFLWGMFKKVVIGDNLAAPVGLVYENVHNYSGFPLIVVFFMQAIHLYCDFSGYTDMALGIARMFGIKLTDNFNRPFFAKNVGEFWRKWHISLSSWCNDFIFSPFIVKYRRFGNRAAIAGIFITFFVIGIWHGANWTFVAVGLLQGIAISYEFVTRRKRIQIASKLNARVVEFISRTLTYLFFSLTLVFFNSHSIGDAFYFLTHMFTKVSLNLSGNRLIFDAIGFLVAAASFGVLYLVEIFQEKGENVEKYFLQLPRLVRWGSYYVLIVSIFYFSGGEDAFVYLQF